MGALMRLDCKVAGCYALFASPSELRAHLQAVHFECGVCGLCCGNRPVLRTHCWEVHRLNVV